MFLLISLSKFASSKRKTEPKSHLPSQQNKWKRLLHQRFPTFRATLSCKLTAPFCRLPLPTLFHRLEAAHLGDLMRLLVRPDVVLLQGPLKPFGHHYDFHGMPIHPVPHRNCGGLSGQDPTSPVKLFPWTSLNINLLTMSAKKR